MRSDQVIFEGAAHSRFLRMLGLSRNSKAQHFTKNAKCGAPTNANIHIILLCIALIASFLFLLSCSKKAAQCPLCDRDVHEGMQVSITHNSIPMKTCCMACAMTYQMQTKNVEIKTATDYLSNTPIDARNAIYLIDSDVSPCIQDPKVQKYIREPHAAMHACYDRCEPGILAFRSKADAQKFQQQHGGFLREFQQLSSLIPGKHGARHD